MSTICCNDHDWGDSFYDLENLFKPHDKYGIDNNVCNNIESGFGRVSTLDPTYLENVQSYVFEKSGFGEVMTLVNVNPTILEECQLCVDVDHCNIPNFQFGMLYIDHSMHSIFLLHLIMILHVIIMREENMVVEIFMLIIYLSLC